MDPATWVPGTPLERVGTYSVSRDTSLLGIAGRLDDGSGDDIVAVNGVEVAREGQPVRSSRLATATSPRGFDTLWSILSSVEVDAGRWVVRGTVDEGGASRGYTEASDGSSVKATQTLDGVPLHDWSPERVVIGHGGRIATLWRGLFGSALFTTCSGNLHDARLVLSEGDRVVWTGSGGGATVLGIFAAVVRANSVEALVRLDAGAQVAVTVLELANPCPFFADGFESGDTSRWSHSP